MEVPLTEALRNVTKEDGVTGAVVSDAHGLCIGTSGNAKQNSSGFIKAIANDAHELSGEHSFTVSIETTTQNILIRDIDDGACFAVFKSPN
eukprot:CAMPEP_0201492216 /NCGR_PEP_ID=MMETSP0151_2-20130828/32240_1 /ASSEMBLY_ACC=CAM_ASM_000257 /TAXON_ID=200890 /ORGANISM="Paramoeba atlantica, Strain 621/1 / CCAP 1560/9" /LENGTH=90 /DNA_ID=CAMNT_0047878903 /DNA_START=54 /DNA_END=326 /DNA_ORIENTATION=+